MLDINKARPGRAWLGQAKQDKAKQDKARLTLKKGTIMEQEVTRKSGNFVRSTETRILIQYLTKHLIEDKQEIVTFGEMAKAIGCNAIGEARDKSYSPRNILNKEYGVMFKTVRGVGIKLTDDCEGIADDSLKNIRNKARKTTRQILNTKIGDLPEERKTAIFSRVSTLGAINQFAKPSSVKKIEGKVKECGNVELPVKETLKMFE